MNILYYEVVIIKWIDIIIIYMWKTITILKLTSDRTPSQEKIQWNHIWCSKIIAANLSESKIQISFSF